MNYVCPQLITDFDPSLGKGVLLFGGSGFLGPYILQNYPDMISVGRSPSPTSNRHIHVDSLDDLRALDDVEFDRVIYIIGNTDHHNLEAETLELGSLTAYDHHPIPLIRTLEQLKGRPLKRFVHFSTVLIYDEKNMTLPVSETHPIDPYKNRYVNSKYLAEEASKFFANWIPTTIVRLNNLYGPTPLRRFDLAHVVSAKLLETGRAEIWTRRPSRDFIYVEDAAHAIVKIVHADYDGTLNLGTGIETLVGDVLDILGEVSGGEIIDLDQHVNGPMRFYCDMTTLRRVIDWEPQVSVREGTRMTYEQMKRWKEA